MKKNIRFTAIILVIVLACGILTACGGGDTKKAADFDIGVMTDELLDSSAFSDILNPIPSDTAMMLYSLTSDQVAECSVCCSTGATAEEIAVFKATSEDAAQKIEAAMKTRVDNQNQAFVSYVPEEIPKLDKAIIVRNGLYVAYVVANDDAAAKTIVEKFM